jgi:nucleoside diphosphate-linked moiety X motif protein 19
VLYLRSFNSFNSYYPLQMIERSKGSSVNPSGTVFPGGALSPVDSSPKWAELYKKVLPEIDLSKLEFMSKNAHIPPIYESDSSVEASGLSKQVIFRLTAIRETFEEVGILLAKRAANVRSEGKPSSESVDKSGLASAPNVEFDELRDRKNVTAWQKRIQKNPDEFLRLCEELDCVPDLWALSEWSNWMTPTIFKAKARFDVMFYMTVFSRMPTVVFDTHEVAGAQVRVTVWIKITKLQRLVIDNLNCFR